MDLSRSQRVGMRMETLTLRWVRDVGRRASLWSLVVTLVTAALPSSGTAQQEPRLFPNGAPFPRTKAGPLEPTLAARLILPFRSPTRFGEVVEGETAIGASVPVLRILGDRQRGMVVVGAEAGVVARFNLETQERDLISSDWVFTVPVVLQRGGHWLRARYYHTSAHLGDEYMQRFDVERVPYARDALDVLGYWRATEWLGIYAGGRWAFRIDPPEHARNAVRGGVELDDPSVDPLRFFIAADIELDQHVRWRPRVDARLGMWLTAAGARPSARIEAGFVTGPSYQGQFADGRAAIATLGLAFGL